MGTAGGTRLSIMLCIALAGAGCGAGHTNTASKTDTATRTNSSPQTTVPAAVAQRVLHNGELAGMNPSPSPTVERDPAVWVAGENFPASEQNAEVSRLRRLGFEAAIAENLVTPGNANRFGLSLLEQFSSRRSAAAELVHETGPSAQGGPWTHFAIPGIPGARGFEATGGSQSGRNVAFADGPYYYLVGAGWNAPASNAVSRAQLIAAALLLYHRVHGKTTG